MKKRQPVFFCLVPWHQACVSKCLGNALVEISRVSFSLFMNTTLMVIITLAYSVLHPFYY